MFRASPNGGRFDLFSNIEQFPGRREQEKLKDPNAWHNVFVDQVTNRVPEERFAVLFDEETGRPNASIRLLVAMLILKEGFGWSDERLFEAIRFNLLVRRALGLVNLTDEVPVESTYYLFKQRLYRYQVATGSNLLNEVFQELTRGQAKRLGDEGVVVIDRETGERQMVEEYKPGRYRFRAGDKWRYITDKDIETAARRRRVENLPRALFNRRCNVEATIFQLCCHTCRKKLKYRGNFAAQVWAVCRAAWINMTRIAGYQAKQAEVIA
jgi:hypothetical protein